MPARSSARGSRIRSHGIEQTFRALGESKRRDGITVSEGIRQCAGKVLEDSRILVPKDTWDLWSTSRVEWNGQHRFAAMFRVVYGGPTPAGGHVDYAVVVHERSDLHHDPPTTHHYLSLAVQMNRTELNQLLGRQFLNQERITRRPDPKFTDKIDVEDWQR